MKTFGRLEEARKSSKLLARRLLRAASREGQPPIKRIPLRHGFAHRLMQSRCRLRYSSLTRSLTNAALLAAALVVAFCALVHVCNDRTLFPRACLTVG
jgi:hypothetical protein